MTDELFARIVAEIPPSWLRPEDGFRDVAEHREAYAAWLRERARAIPVFLEEAKNARAALV
jgi:hypothetical protein